ncbi:MAG: hypothetical protein MN733_27270 [Nitrososphaera sp.]|nr:hypothetical protein [Nitrososphaera sp.]
MQKRLAHKKSLYWLVVFGLVAGGSGLAQTPRESQNETDKRVAEEMRAQSDEFAQAFQLYYFYTDGLTQFAKNYKELASECDIAKRALQHGWGGSISNIEVKATLIGAHFPPDWKSVRQGTLEAVADLIQEQVVKQSIDEARLAISHIKRAATNPPFEPELFKNASRQVIGNNPRYCAEPHLELADGFELRFRFSEVPWVGSYSYRFRFAQELGEGPSFYSNIII